MFDVIDCPSEKNSQNDCGIHDFIARPAFPLIPKIPKEMARSILTTFLAFLILGFVGSDAQNFKSICAHPAWSRSSHLSILCENRKYAWRYPRKPKQQGSKKYDSSQNHISSQKSFHQNPRSPTYRDANLVEWYPIPQSHVKKSFRQLRISPPVKQFIQFMDDADLNLKSSLPLVFPYHKLVIFGDSLSSTDGTCIFLNCLLTNLFISVANEVPDYEIRPPNYPFYHGDRLTDGQVWHEYLQIMADTQYRLGWKYETKIYNFARPWASVLPQKLDVEIKSPSLAQQVQSYLCSETTESRESSTSRDVKTIDEDFENSSSLDEARRYTAPYRRRLYVIWMGGNDIIQNRHVEAWTIMEEIMKSIELLLKKDPKASVLIPSTLPGEMLPFTPKSTRAQKIVLEKMNELREAQKKLVSQLKKKYQRNDFYFVDTMELVRYAASHLADFDFDETLEPCLRQKSTGKPLIHQPSTAIKWNSQLTNEDYFMDIELDVQCLQQSRLFVDGVHISSAMHKFIAELFLTRLSR